MLEKDAILYKISIVNNCLDRIQKTTGFQPDSLDDFDKQDIFILNLQRAIQAVIDIANLIISANNYRLAVSYKSAFLILNENAWIDKKTALSMQRMAGFRNIAIHDYQELDINILKDILVNHINELNVFCKKIVKRYR